MVQPALQHLTSGITIALVLLDSPTAIVRETLMSVATTHVGMGQLVSTPMGAMSANVSKDLRVVTV